LFRLSAEEIDAGTESISINEVALNADPRINFRVELSGLQPGSAYFTRYRVSRRVVDEKGLLTK
jgi:hypothetical protein